MKKLLIISLFTFFARIVLAQTMVQLEVWADGKPATCLNSEDDITWSITNQRTGKTATPETTFDWYTWVDGSHYTISLQDLENEGAFRTGDIFNITVTITSSTCMVNYSGKVTIEYDGGAFVQTEGDLNGYLFVNTEAPKPTIEVTGTSFCAGESSGKSVSAKLTNVPAGCTINWGNGNITTAGTLAAGATSATGNIGAGLTTSASNIRATLVNSSGTEVATSAPYSVTVNPKPTLTISGDKEVCLGSTLSLTAAPTPSNATVTWQTPGANNFTGTNYRYSSLSQSYSGVKVSASAAGCTSDVQTFDIVAKPVPVATLKAEPTNICSGKANEVKLTASNTNTNVMVSGYTWTNASALGQGAEGTVSANATTTYKVIANGSNGCNSAEVSATVTGYSVGVRIDGTKSVNYDGSTELTAVVNPPLPTGITVATYNWTPTASIAGEANASKMNTANLKVATEYTVEVTDSQGCTGTNKATVLVNGGALAVNPSGGDKLYCLGTQAVSGLNAGDEGGSGSASYKWSSLPDGLVFDLSTPRTPKIQPTSAEGTYSVTVEVTKGSETLSKTLNNVKVYKTPVLGNISVSSSEPKDGDVVELTLASVDPETASLTWSAAQSSTPLASTSGQKVSTGKLSSGAHTYTVKADNNKCEATKSVTVNVGKMADIVITPPATTPKGNIGEPFEATVTVTGGNGTYDKYEWTAPAGVTISGTGTTATITSSTPGTKEVCVEVWSGGVSAKRCFNVVVTDPSKIGLTMTVDKKCAYEGEELTITIDGNGADTYSFSLRDQSNAEVMKVTDDASGRWLYQVKADKAGTYKIADFKYKISGVESDGEIVEPVTALFDPVPDVKAQVDGLASINHCEGDELTLKGTSGDTEGLQYTWDNGVTDGVSFIPMISGDYTVTGTNPTTKCAGKATVSVMLQPRPTVQVPAIQEICAGDLVTLSATGSEDVTEFKWNNGVTNDVPFKPEFTAVYEVTATNANGCTITDSTRVVVNQAPEIIRHSKNPRNIAIGKDAYFAVEATGGNLTYTWQKKEGEEWVNLEDVTSSAPIILGSTTDSISLLTVPKSWDGSEFRVVIAGECGETSMEFQLSVKECFEISAELAMFDGIIPDEDPGNRIDGWFCRGRQITLKTIITSLEGYDIENPHYKWSIDGLDLPEEHVELVSDTAILTWVPSFTEDDIVVRVSAYCDGACEEVVPKYLRLKAREFDDVTLKIMTNRDPEHLFCAGDTVNFWLATRNVGKAPQYKWYNDIFVLPEEQSPKNELLRYDSANIVMVMGQEDTWMRVEMTPSPEICVKEPVVIDTVFMKKKPWMEPELHIDCSDTLVCRGDSVSMLAIHANAGSKPTFQWQRSIGEPFPDWNLGTEHFATVFVDEDDVWVKCTMTPSNDVCYDQSKSIVDALRINVFKDSSEVLITSDLEDKLPGEEVVFEAEVKNLLGEPRYEWYVNEMKSPCTDAEYITSSVSQGDIVYCLVSGDKNCQTRIKSNEIIVDYGHINRDTMLVIYKNERVKDLNMQKEGDDLALVLFKIETPARFGVGTISTDGQFSYTPLAGFTGTDEVKYVVVNRRDKSVVAEGYIYVTVKENDRFFVPNLITPNGDGINDTWQLDFLSEYPDHLIQVFDRSGRIVFEARNYQNDWDGKGMTKSGYVGQVNLVNGIYTYMIDLGDKNKTILKSWLEIRANLNRRNYR